MRYKNVGDVKIGKGIQKNLSKALKVKVGSFLSMKIRNGWYQFFVWTDFNIDLTHEFCSSINAWHDFKDNDSVKMWSWAKN